MSWKPEYGERSWVKNRDQILQRQRESYAADPTKDRSQYLELLQLAVREDPYGDRNA